MADDNKFATYCSHSWRPRDVDLNLQVWGELASDCELLVDVPEELGANPPYYINRIEELLRRSDLFLGILVEREPPKDGGTGQDANLRCSPYALFEIRLAERADMPRLIIYERSSGFRPPRNLRPWEMYVPFDRWMKDRLPEQGQWAKVVRPKIQQWKEWARGHRLPMSYELSTRAAMIGGVPLSGPAIDVVEGLLRNNGYEPVRCDIDRQRSSEVFRVLREAGLVVTDFSGLDGGLAQLYGAVHSLGLPSVRMIQSFAGLEIELPWILRGDPGGYQNDIVTWQVPVDLPGQVEPRIKAMSRLSRALRDGEATDYLQSKRYSQFFVFISHSLKGPDRVLVEEIYQLLKQRQVTPFEYHEVNVAGTDWRQALNDSLAKTTHFIPLLDPDYEKSPTCTYELEEILKRGNQVRILPFMIAGRDRPNPKLVNLHNRLLSGKDVPAEAGEVVREVISALDTALDQPGSG
jgi:hypothetical protein